MTSTTGTIPPTHRRFNEDQAMEQIRNRYELIREKIPNQLDALQHDAHFREFCGDIYGRGYKDWMILATIYNAVLNLKLHERQVDCLDPDAMSRAMQQISLEPIDDVYLTENFIGTAFEMCLKTFNMTCLMTWGFHPRVRMLKPDVVERFLRERMRHFDFDLPHNSLFGDPPGEWPS